MTRVRQATAPRKTATLSPVGSCIQQRQYLDRAPARERRPGAVLLALLQGLLERPWFRRSFLFSHPHAQYSPKEDPTALREARPRFGAGSTDCETAPLFTEAACEGQIDFDTLRPALGDGMAARPDRFSWD